MLLFYWIAIGLPPQKAPKIDNISCKDIKSEEENEDPEDAKKVNINSVSKEITRKIKKADREFAFILYRETFPEPRRGSPSGGLLTRLCRDFRFCITAFPRKKEYDVEICKIIYFFTMLEHTTIIPNIQGKNSRTKGMGKNGQYFYLTDFLSSPSMESTGEKFLCDKKHKRFNAKITDFIKNELEKEIYLKERSIAEIDNIRKNFKTIANAWKELFDNIHKTLDKDSEIDFDQMIHICNSINPPFPPYEEIQRLYNYRNPEPKVDNQKDENPYSASPIVALYFKILQFEFLGEINDRRTLNRIQVDTEYNVPQRFIESMNAYKDQIVKYSDLEEYIMKHINCITRCIYTRSNPTAVEKKKVKDHIKDIHKILDCCIYAERIIKSKNEISKLLIISCFQAIILDDDNPEDEYVFYDYQYHLKSTHNPKISCKPIDDGKKAHFSLQRLYWGQKVAAHWYANLGKHELYCKSRILEEHLYRILIRLCSTDNIEEMKSYSEERYEKLDSFFRESCAKC